MSDTMETYQPNGIPLTDYERELLVILMEECSEVIQAAAKLIRFGRENRPDSGESNVKVLGAEVGDVVCVVDLAMEAELMRGPDIHNGKLRKQKRLQYFMQTKGESE